MTLISLLFAISAFNLQNTGSLEKHLILVKWTWISF